MLELDEIRSQLNIEPEDTSDALLTRYLRAAVRRFEYRTGRSLFKSQDDLPTPTPANALVLDADVALALLLLIGHWNVNREDVTDAQLAPIPHGFNDLAEPHRWWPDC